jgi:hypothetical protein
MIFSRPRGNIGDVGTPEDFCDDPQLRALREQFPRVDPHSLCLPGGMTRSEFVKFLTMLSESIRRDSAPGNTH